jgi:hypothetical protein
MTTQKNNNKIYQHFVIMVLLATNTRNAKSVCYSTSNRPDSSFDDSNLDDLSVAVTLKQSNVTIEQVRIQFRITFVLKSILLQWPSLPF